MDFKKELGKKGEQLAVEWLIQNGYSIKATNWRYLKGEVDIICQKSNLIIFAEVKTRSSSEFGNPEEFVTKKQQKLIVNTAHQYLILHQLDMEARFDIVSIIIQQDGSHVLEHLEDAFGPIL